MKPGLLYRGTRLGLDVMISCLNRDYFLVFWPEDAQMKRAHGFSTTNNLQGITDIEPLYTFTASEGWVRGLLYNLELASPESMAVADQLRGQIPPAPVEPKNPGAVVALIPHGIAVRTDEGVWIHRGVEKSWDQLAVSMIASPGWAGDGDVD